MRPAKAKRTRQPAPVESVPALEATIPDPVAVCIEGQWTVPVAAWAALTVTPHARSQRVTLDVHQGDAVVWTDDVVLTRAMERRRFCKLLAAARGIPVTESALLALNVALHGPPVDHVALADSIIAEMLAAREAIDPLLAEAEAQDQRDRTGTLLDGIDALLRNYVAMSEAQRTAIVLWTANTHVFDARGTVPYLHIISATPESGKTRIFEVIEPIVRHGRRDMNMSEAALFRIIDRERPTLLHDEIDAVFGKDAKSESSVRMQGILRAGYRRGATVVRCVGEDNEPQDFTVFCPKAFAGTREVLDPALRGRCITIRQRKRREDEWVGDWFDEEYTPWGQEAGAALEAWAPHAAAVLRTWVPVLPEGLRDRAMELWRPLAAIAELAGGDWPARCEDAIRALSRDVPENQDVRLLLLAAFRDLFTDLGDKVCSAIALELLIEREMEPWGKWWADDVQRARRSREAGDLRAYAAKATAGLAGLLRPFGILPKVIRLGAGTIKGYDAADFEDAFARHLSLSTPLREVGRGNSVTTLAAQGVEGVIPPSAPEVGGNTGKPCGTRTVTPLRPGDPVGGVGAENNGGPVAGWRCAWCRSTTRFERGDHYVCGGCHHRTPREAREPGIEG